MNLNINELNQKVNLIERETNCFGAKSMEYKGAIARVMLTPRIYNSIQNSLPSGVPATVFKVDNFIEPLEHWIKGNGSYVIPISSEVGLWFDWTQNDAANTAILPTVKGMNPITGQRTNGFALERYENKCPVHNSEFSDGLYCKECDFKWPPQNYIAYPNILWVDGFRTGDGKVRQFFFTEDLAKSIPELVIGKEDTVPAFGFAFFKPKKQRVFENTQYRGGIITSDFTYKSFGGGSSCGASCGDVKALYIQSGGNLGLGCINPTEKLSINENTSYASYAAGMETKTSGGPICCSGGPISPPQSSMKQRIMKSSFTLNKVAADFDSFDSIEINSSPEVLRKAKAEVGVGAGAEISQDITVDTLKVSDWEETPSATMRLYFIFIEQFKEISSHGLKNLTGAKEGYLQGLPVG